MGGSRRETDRISDGLVVGLDVAALELNACQRCCDVGAVWAEEACALQCCCSIVEGIARDRFLGAAEEEGK